MRQREHVVRPCDRIAVAVHHQDRRIGGRQLELHGVGAKYSTQQDFRIRRDAAEGIGAVTVVSQRGGAARQCNGGHHIACIRRRTEGQSFTLCHGHHTLRDAAHQALGMAAGEGHGIGSHADFADGELGPGPGHCVVFRRRSVGHGERMVFAGQIEVQVLIRGIHPVCDGGAGALIIILRVETALIEGRRASVKRDREFAAGKSAGVENEAVYLRARGIFLCGGDVRIGDRRAGKPELSGGVFRYIGFQ